MLLFYDGFYGELGLNDDDFDAIVSRAKKPDPVLLIPSYKFRYLLFNLQET
jgi:hypothetical protein